MTPRRTRARTPLADFAAMARRAADQNDAPAFAKYRDDPVGFARDVFAFEPWRGQREILTSLAEHDLVSCVSGHGVGKSAAAALAALWFWSTRGPGARVILLSPTFRQTSEVLWMEIKKLVRAARVPLGGSLGQLVSTGLRSQDGREIFGVAPDTPVALQGIRAPEMLVVVDESSGVLDEVFESVLSLIAGGGKLLLLGNPTATRPPFSFFYRSHRDEAFKRICIPSTSSPNVEGDEIVVKGLVTAAWIRDRAAQWGEDSALFKIKILGQFVEGAEGRLFTPEMISAAEARWRDATASGRLIIGLDPAGASGKGDSSAFVVRRGMKIVDVYTRTGLSEEAHVVEALGLIAKHRGSPADGLPLIAIDRDGHVGARVYTAFSTYQMNHDGVFALRGVRGGERAKRQPNVYHLVRHELYFALLDAFREGLAIPEHVRLAHELSVIKQETHRSGLSMVTHKDDMRKELNGRSPDIADALALTCVPVSSWSTATDAGRDPPPPARLYDPYRTVTEQDPYRGSFDPYAAADIADPRYR